MNQNGADDEPEGQFGAVRTDAGSALSGLK